MKETYFDYDSENDSLFVYRKAKIKGSIDVGYFVIDISTEGKVIGLEILNISEVIKNSGISNAKEFLDNIKKAGFRAVYHQDSIIVYFMVFSKAREVTSSIAVPIKYK
jgi:uncharacterized protein YuzE